MSINTDAVLNAGFIGYEETPQKAMERLGGEPLLIKGIGISSYTDIIISDIHAKALLQADSEGHFLQNAKVVILKNKIK